MTTSDDDAAAFYDDPANREFHGPGHRRSSQPAVTGGTYNDGWERGWRFHRDDQ